MGINYTILKSSIVNSSIWNEDSDTRVVWITILALRNKDGEVYASVGGLAHQARVSREKAERAIKKFMEPEPDSSSRDDGRRLEEIPGGWRLLNHDRIQEEAKAANHAVYMAGYMRKHRQQERVKKGLPQAGALEYEAAMKRGASQAELDAIVTRHLPAKAGVKPVKRESGYCGFDD